MTHSISVAEPQKLTLAEYTKGQSFAQATVSMSQICSICHDCLRNNCKPIKQSRIVILSDGNLAHCNCYDIQKSTHRPPEAQIISYVEKNDIAAIQNALDNHTYDPKALALALVRAAMFGFTDAVRILARPEIDLSYLRLAFLAVVQHHSLDALRALCTGYGRLIETTDIALTAIVDAADLGDCGSLNILLNEFPKLRKNPLIKSCIDTCLALTLRKHDSATHRLLNEFKTEFLA
jgi:hypothetical protein